MTSLDERFPYTYKLILAYDGTEYHGWQIQPNGVTIQEILQEKLFVLLKRKIDVVGAGRTDAGVHALGQTAHFRHDKELDTFKILASLNGLLPKDIRVKSIKAVPKSFHARFSAINKEYHYHLNIGKVQDPFCRLYSWHIFESLNFEKLSESANLFLGTHDFTSFANEPTKGAAAKNPVRTIKRIDLVEEKSGIRIEFEGPSFLYKMVRNLTGAMVNVARGKSDIAKLSEVLTAKDRRLAPRPAPARGLFLVRIDYPEISNP